MLICHRTFLRRIWCILKRNQQRSQDIQISVTPASAFQLRVRIETRTLFFGWPRLTINTGRPRQGPHDSGRTQIRSTILAGSVPPFSSAPTQSGRIPLRCKHQNRICHCQQSVAALPIIIRIVALGKASIRSDNDDPLYRQSQIWDFRTSWPELEFPG